MARITATWPKHVWARGVKNANGKPVKVRVKRGRLNLLKEMAVITYTSPGLGVTNPDTAPDQFTFTDQTDVELSTLIESIPIQITGFTSGPITISGTNNPEYKINGGAYTSAAGTIFDQDTLTIRHTSSAFGGIGVDTLVDIGGVSDTFTSVTIATASVLAFPGAEGMGANATGGRNAAATIYVVSNLNDTGAGSFREAVTATGPRYVVFSVAGNINLQSEINILTDFLHIAGQTSPGGICITGFPVFSRADHVVHRYIRYRRGSQSGDGPDPPGNWFESLGESIHISQSSHVVVDHCSISWGTDETFQVGSFWGDCVGITISWCMIYEGLQNPHSEPNHGMGLIISDKFYNIAPPQVSVHHTFQAHHRDRSPRLSGKTLIDYRNNINYDWFHQTGSQLILGEFLGDGDFIPKVNLVSNYYKDGPNGNANGIVGFFSSNANTTTVPEAAKNTVYVLNNEGEDTVGTPLWTTGGEYHISKQFGPSSIHADYEKATPWDMTTEGLIGGIPVTTTIMTAAYADTILLTCGASFPTRDAADARQVTEYDAGTGDLILDVTFPGDFPTLTDTGAPTDSNSDGIPDSYDSAHNFTTNGIDDIDPLATITLSDVTPRSVSSIHVGYQWIEAYINGLV